MTICQIISYFFIILVIGVSAYPLTAVLFSGWKSGGWGFSKIVGLTVLTFLAWLIGFGTGLNLDQSICVALVILLCLSGASIALMTMKKRPVAQLNIRAVAEEELVFGMFCLLFLLIRAGNPDIWHPVMGGEKFMDFAFINSIIRSNQVPPLDPWFAGETINYYYMGHFLVALTIKLSGVLPDFGYNLAIAYLFGQTAVGIYSLATYLGLPRLIRLVTTVLAVVSGNFAQVKVILSKINGNYVPINGWYWTATRVMPGSEINEFPFFTFLYADLHAHLIAFPLLLLVIALGVSWLRTRDVSFGRGIVVICYSSFLLAFIKATNTWDWPTCLALTVGLMALGILLRRFGKMKTKLLTTLAAIGTLGVLTFLFGVPFSSLYKSGQLGLAFFSGTRTSLVDYFLINGFFLVIGGVYLISTVCRSRIRWYKYVLALGLVVISFVIARNLGGVPFLPVFTIAGVASLLTIAKPKIGRNNLANLVAVTLFMAAMGLTLIPDLVYFSLGLGRMNMVFKYFLQAWFLFSIAAGIMIWQTDSRLINKKILRVMWRIFVALLFFGTLIYPATATPAKIKDKMAVNQDSSLDGSMFMAKAVYYDQNEQSDLKYDLEAINWLNKNVAGSPTLLEANTPSYRWGGRIAVFTGLPTVIGWGWHEVAHRSYLPASEIAMRENDVKLAYETQSFDEFMAIAKKYKVAYIYIGDLERMYYGEAGMNKFTNPANPCLAKRYQNTRVTIYTINQKCFDEK